ncbi:hypothetical protein B0H19DRAFT_652870 [Mycena capillaripes]|nr:hypothetical protein B0H19DRAFT_652870 [Mycena capillaripes]
MDVRGDTQIINYTIAGGTGGVGGQGDEHGGSGGLGMGPIIQNNFMAAQLTINDVTCNSDAVTAARIATRCPPPSRIFHGRKAILVKMDEFFTINMGKQQNIYVLHGLGGTGKTQIAFKFIKDSSSW